MEEVQLKDKCFVKSIDAETIAVLVDKTAKAIKASAGEKQPLFLVVLSGAFVFASDLTRAYEGNCDIRFIKMSSYKGTQSTGDVKTEMGLDVDLTNRWVVLVEDIVDTGNTIEALMDMLSDSGAESVKVASLFLKPDVYQKDIPVDFVGMEIANEFIVGYGLDYDGLGRNLKHVYKLKENA